MVMIDNGEHIDFINLLTLFHRWLICLAFASGGEILWELACISIAPLSGLYSWFPDPVDIAYKAKELLSKTSEPGPLRSLPFNPMDTFYYLHHKNIRSPKDWW